MHDDAVTFRTKNGKTVAVTPVEFLRRFVQHVLIRHYGLYAGAAENARLAAQQLLDPRYPRTNAAASLAWPEQLRELTGQ